MSHDRYELQYPIQIKTAAGEEVAAEREVKLRRLTGADLAAIAQAGSKGPGDALMEMVCRVASVPPSTFNRMDAADAAALAEIAANFIGRALPTGGM